MLDARLSREAWLLRDAWFLLDARLLLERIQHSLQLFIAERRHAGRALLWCQGRDARQGGLSGLVGSGRRSVRLASPKKRGTRRDREHQREFIHSEQIEPRPMWRVLQLRFRLLTVATREQAGAKVVTMASDPANPELSVVLVEDDARLARLTAQYLESHGVSVTIVARGDQAVAEVMRGRPDVVLLDVMLPGASGNEVCRELRKRLDVPIIMLTARTEEGGPGARTGGRRRRLRAQAVLVPRAPGANPCQRATRSGPGGTPCVSASSSASWWSMRPA